MSRHEHRFDWRTLLFYGFVSVLVLVVGATILYSFFEKQGLRQNVAAEPLPNVVVVTSDDEDELAAAWTGLLGTSDLPTTLVTPDKFQPTKGVVALCSLKNVDPRFRSFLEEHLRAGGGVAVMGAPPAALADLLGTAEMKSSEGVVRIADHPSPVLARVQPGHELGARAAEVAMLDETPAMTVDARWSGNARAAVAHFNVGGGRVLWFGLHPSALYVPNDRQLALLLRTGFRWLSGQPVSDGAVGAVVPAKALAPAARVEARRQKFSFSVDRLEKPGMLSVRISNRGNGRLLNPTVKIWLPPQNRSVTVSGSFVARRRVDITAVPEEGAILVTLPVLERHEERLLKLKTR